MRLSIQNISKAFGANTIVSDFSLEISSGTRLCICGANGTGKSTLIKAFAGKEALDFGKVILPKNCRMGYAEQEFDEITLQIPLLTYVLSVLPDWAEFWQKWDKAASTQDEASILKLSERQAQLEQVYGYNPEHQAKTVLTGLGFKESTWLKPLQELSGGWREKAKLARILTAGADILLLDEPTNHLDLEAVEWLENFLMEYKGVLVFVAHDLIFMDKISTHILYLGAGKPVYRKGNFSQFISTQEELEEQKEREVAKLQDDIDKKMVFVRRFKAKASKARQASSKQKMAKKLEKQLDGLAPTPRRKELNFKWPSPPQSDQTVLSVADLSFAFPDGKKMWEQLSFILYRGQKIALVGHNGCGKSTLLRLLIGKLEKNAGTIQLGQMVKLGHFSQHQMETLNPDSTVLGEIRRLSDPRTTEEELMSVLGLFLLGQNYFDRLVANLSGGEKSRLILASLFLARCNFLILDEPTNHLDLESREALVESLSNFPGTILMVAHDRHLLAEVAEEIWLLQDGVITNFKRGYEEYSEFRKNCNSITGQLEQVEEKQDKNSLSREELRQVKREQAEIRNQIYKELKPLQDKYKKLEENLELNINKQTELEKILADPEIYADSGKATQLLKDFHELQHESELLMEKLAALEEKMTELEEKRSSLIEE